MASKSFFGAPVRCRWSVRCVRLSLQPVHYPLLQLRRPSCMALKLVPLQQTLCHRFVLCKLPFCSCISRTYPESSSGSSHGYSLELESQGCKPTGQGQRLPTSPTGRLPFTFLRGSYGLDGCTCIVPAAALDCRCRKVKLHEAHSSTAQNRDASPGRQETFQCRSLKSACCFSMQSREADGSLSVDWSWSCSLEDSLRVEQKMKNTVA